MGGFGLGGGGVGGRGGGICGGFVGGMGGIDGGGRSMRFGSCVVSHIMMPMGNRSTKMIGKQHQSEKHGHSFRKGGTLRRSTTSTLSYTSTFGVLVAPVDWPTSE